MKKNIFLFILIFLLFAKSAYGQEMLLSVENAKSYVLDLDDGGKKYLFEDFLKPATSFLEGHKLEVHIFISRIPTSNPKDTYVLETRTDLWPAKWQYKTKLIEAAKTTVWDSPQDHFDASFEIVLTGNVPKPTITIREPNFKDYTGEGPGLRNSELVVFTIYNGQVDPNKKVQEVGGYYFLSTNSNINGYLEEIKKNLDTSGLNEKYANAMEEQKNYILWLSNNGHVGIAFDLSNRFAEIVEKLKISSPSSDNTLLIAVVVAILLALVLFVVGYKVGRGKEPIDFDQIDKSYNTLKQNLEKLEKLDISTLDDTQASDLEAIKKRFALDIAGLKNALNQLRK